MECKSPPSYGPSLAATCFGTTPLALASWCLGWYGLFSLVFFFEPAPYVLAVALAIHVRFRPPLGQVLPLPDPMLIFVWPCTLPFVFMSAFGVWWSWKSTQTVVWSCATGVFASAVVRRWLACEKVRDQFGHVGGSKVAFPKRPCLTRFHGYFYGLYNTVDGHSGDVVGIERVICEGSERKVEVDVWRLPCCDSKAPVFFFLHGGGWKGGGARMNSHSRQMQLLSARGWRVVSVAYRMSKWPEHVGDALDAYRCILKQGDGGRQVAVSGASAGGHILLLSMIQAVAEGLPLPKACVLFYPALDVEDITRVTATWPWPCPCGPRRSMLSWFFEHFILKGEEWSTADALRQLLDRPDVAGKWPPTMVFHGDRDSVVPIEHSQHFLSILARAHRATSVSSDIRGSNLVDNNVVENIDTSTMLNNVALSPMLQTNRDIDQLVVIPGGRHTYDIVDCQEAQDAYVGAADWLDREFGR